MSINKYQQDSKQYRQANMELLRIIAMILVLAVHANFYSLGTPRNQDIITDFTSSIFRIFLNFTSVTCVTIFILISGWFSIKFSKKGLLKLAFQCLYFSFGLLLLSSLIGRSTPSLSSIQNCLYLSRWDWFVKSYIALMILAPVLNTFIENATKKQIELFIISFYIFQTIFAFRGAALFIQNGYSAFSFIGLYILGRYLRLYTHQKLKKRWYITAIISATVLNSTVYTIDAYEDTWMLSGICMSYANPLNIFCAVCTLELFASLKIKGSKMLFFFSTSSFAVYLFHYDQHILNDIFCPASRYIFHNFEGLNVLGVYVVFIFAIFIISVLLDQPRKLLWNRFEKLLMSNRVHKLSAKIIS